MKKPKDKAEVVEGNVFSLLIDNHWFLLCTNGQNVLAHFPDTVFHNVSYNYVSSCYFSANFLIVYCLCAY